MSNTVTNGEGWFARWIEGSREVIDGAVDGINQAKSELQAAIDALPAEARCLRCGGFGGNHGLVHVRHGNGGGHNEPCPVVREREIEAKP